MEMFWPFILRSVKNLRAKCEVYQQLMFFNQRTVPVMFNDRCWTWDHPESCWQTTSISPHMTAPHCTRLYVWQSAWHLIPAVGWGTQLVCCASSTWLKYSYHHARATKLLPYLSHKLMLSLASPAWGHKEVRYSTWLLRVRVLNKNLASKNCCSCISPVVWNKLIDLISLTDSTCCDHYLHWAVI